MATDLVTRLHESFRWLDDEDGAVSDPSAWWGDADILAELGPALGALHESSPTVVAGIEARGFVLGPLVAVALGVGFVEVRRDLRPDVAAERLLRRTTPPDYRDRSITFSVRRAALSQRDRVLLVDDWVETGAQARAVRDIVDDAEARWVGVAAIVDATESGTRRTLNVRSLLREPRLPWYGRRRK